MLSCIRKLNGPYFFAGCEIEADDMTRGHALEKYVELRADLEELCAGMMPGRRERYTAILDDRDTFFFTYGCTFLSNLSPFVSQGLDLPLQPSRPKVQRPIVGGPRIRPFFFGFQGDTCRGVPGGVKEACQGCDAPLTLFLRHGIW